MGWKMADPKAPAAEELADRMALHRYTDSEGVVELAADILGEIDAAVTEERDRCIAAMRATLSDAWDSDTPDDWADDVEKAIREGVPDGPR